jgi:hypothetical protein
LACNGPRPGGAFILPALLRAKQALPGENLYDFQIKIAPMQFLSAGCGKSALLPCRRNAWHCGAASLARIFKLKPPYLFFAKKQIGIKKFAKKYYKIFAFHNTAEVIA